VLAGVVVTHTHNHNNPTHTPPPYTHTHTVAIGEAGGVREEIEDGDLAVRGLQAQISVGLLLHKHLLLLLLLLFWGGGERVGVCVGGEG
jgi:hypothetical protein